MQLITETGKKLEISMFSNRFGISAVIISQPEECKGETVYPVYSMSWSGKITKYQISDLSKLGRQVNYLSIALSRKIKREK